MRRLLTLLAALSAFAGAVVTHHLLLRGEERAYLWGTELVYLPSPTAARLASLGHPTLAADWYWLQALQYYGEEGNRTWHYRDLHRFVDLVVTLDPDFAYAYRFGGTAVPYHTGDWKWLHVPQATSLLERGLERFPDDWRMWQQLAFLRGIVGTDYEGAANAIHRAAEVPDAPYWLPRLTTRLLATGGELERARAYAQEILSNTDDAQFQADMRRRLDEIELEERLRAVDRAIASFQEQRGHPPESVEGLVRAGYLSEVPLSPFGGSLRIEDGEAVAEDLRKGRLRVFDQSPR